MAERKIAFFVSTWASDPTLFAWTWLKQSFLRVRCATCVVRCATLWMLLQPQIQQQMQHKDAQPGVASTCCQLFAMPSAHIYRHTENCLRQHQPQRLCAQRGRHPVRGPCQQGRRRRRHMVCRRARAARPQVPTCTHTRAPPAPLVPHTAWRWHATHTRWWCWKQAAPRCRAS